MGIGRIVSFKRQSSVPVFGRIRPPNLQTLQSSPTKSSIQSSDASTSTEITSITPTSNVSTFSSSNSSSPKTCSTECDSNSSTFTSSLNNASLNDEDQKSTWVQKKLDYGFRVTGHFISDYPMQILVTFLVLTVICSIKVPFTKQEDDLKSGYTPIRARSHQELALYSSFFNSASGEPLSIVVFITARDNKTMTRREYLNETVDLMDRIGNEFKLSNQSFYQFCSDFCYVNEPVRQFRNGLLVSNAALNWSLITQGEVHDRIQLDFPFMQMLGRRLDLSPNFFGVQKFASNEAQLTTHSPTNIEYLRLVVLQFRAEKPINASKDDIEQWERSITNFVNSEYKSQNIQTMALTVTLARDEIVRTGMTLFPFLSVGFLIMSVFSIATVYLSACYYQQWSAYKIYLALWACICPLLATSTALGFLFWCGFRFGSILCVTPFLVMAIGVDDAFLIIHSWQRIQSENKLTNTKTSIRNCMAEMLADVGPSITITSLTNCLAFMVGIFSPTPEIQLFCAGNAVAIFADYLFQLFLFGPVLIILAERESVDRCVKPTKKQIEQQHRLQKKANLFMVEYCSWLCNRFTLVFVLLLLCVYWTVSLKGMVTITPRITPKKLFLHDSIINDINKLRDDFILPGYTAISVFVNHVGNLSDPIRRERVESLIVDFEAESQCLGAEFTHFWLRDYTKYTQDASNEEETDLNEVGEFSKNQMSTFLSWPEYKHWNGFLRFNESTGELEKFFSIIAFHGSEMVAWESRGKLLNRWRSIADQYNDLEAFVWVDEAQFLDQIETLIPSTIQSSIATLLCMALVCVIFMGDLFTLAVATLSIMSICLGVFGFLSLWGIDLDPISMATTIMSIGFSVDFPAHLTYHYNRLGKENGGRLTPEERIYHSLVAIGYPLIQCGLSTILFVTCLLFIDTYMSEVFVKTMCLVVSLGLIHALLLIPTMLCAFSQINQHVRTAISMDSLLLKLNEKLYRRSTHRVKPTRITVAGCVTDVKVVN